MKKISILGSTGSIGTQTLDVISNLSNVKIIGLSSNKNMKLLSEQIKEFKPKLVSVGNEDKRKELLNLLREKNHLEKIEVFIGEEGLLEIARDESEMIITAVVGIVGLKPTIEAIKNKKTIGLANKEVLVAAGEIVIKLAKEYGSKIIPIDSEHSAIHQCLRGEKIEEVNKIIITASGGPFREKNIEELKNITVKEALKHPNWSMGKKISIDSATMVNKGLEVIEARWIFGMEPNKIEAIIHPQSIIHSMVEYIDGSVIANLGNADMRIPIQYAITYPNRVKNNAKKLDFSISSKLTFEEIDYKIFKGFKLALDALEEGGTMPSVFNAANEKLVSLFLKEKIGYLDISNGIEEIMGKHETIQSPNLEEIVESDMWARNLLSKKNHRRKEV